MVDRSPFLNLLAASFAGPLQVVAGQSLFTDHHPSGVEQCVVFIGTGGTPRLHISGLRWTHVQMMARSKDHDWAKSRAWLAHELVDLMPQQCPIVLGASPNQLTILNAIPVSEPVYLGRDDSSAYLFALNLRFQLGVTARQ